MEYQKQYNKIYSTSDDYGYLNILLYNEVENEAILFDGLNFYYRDAMTSIPEFFKELGYSLKSKDKNFVIEAIKQAWDVTFIRLTNGDIFQLYFVADDNNRNQRLSIFTKEEHSKMMTPLEISVYDSAVKRCNDAEDCEIDIEENTE